MLGVDVLGETFLFLEEVLGETFLFLFLGEILLGRTSLLFEAFLFLVLLFLGKILLGGTSLLLGVGALGETLLLLGLVER